MPLGIVVKMEIVSVARGDGDELAPIGGSVVSSKGKAVAVTLIVLPLLEAGSGSGQCVRSYNWEGGCFKGADTSISSS